MEAVAPFQHLFLFGLLRRLWRINLALAVALSHYDFLDKFIGHGFWEIKELSDTLNTAVGELSKVESLRRELMADIFHDLRTPLSLIYSYAEMMHDFPAEVTPEQSYSAFIFDI